jgi:type IV pilus biogenesis/stability protein PilW
MSLIIDALKKAQQLRLKEFKGAPFLKSSRPEKKSLINFRRRWIMAGAGLVCSLIFIFLIGKPTFLSSTVQPNQTISFPKKKPPVFITPTLSLPPQGGGVDKAEGYCPEADRAPNHIGSGQARAEGLPYVGAALSGRPSLPEGGPSIEERGEEPLVKKMPKETKTKKATRPQKGSIEKISPPILSASLKEDVLPKSIGVEEEGGKARPLTSEVLNHFNLGVQFYNEREIPKAIQAYQRAIELDPSYIEAYNNLGIIYQELGDFENALKVYQKAIEINPRYEKAYNNLGILFYLQDRYEEALESFQKALAINPNNMESYINCGILFKKKGQWDKAIESYQKALAINPLHGEIHYNIALLYEQLENVELAVDHYQTFIQLSSKSHPDLVSKVERHLNKLTRTKNR